MPLAGYQKWLYCGARSTYSFWPSGIGPPPQSIVPFSWSSMAVVLELYCT